MFIKDSEIWGLRFRDLGSSFSRYGSSFSRFGVFVFEIGVFVFEIWGLRFRDLGSSFFGLRFRVLRFRNYRPFLPFSSVAETTGRRREAILASGEALQTLNRSVAGKFK